MPSCGGEDSHKVLVSATASGELHFWDASTGAFIFNAPMQHPNNAGASALGSSEEAGTAEDSDPNAGSLAGERVVIGGSGGGGGGGGLGEVRVAGTAVDRASLMLYTACEEGFVKTWRVGEENGETDNSYNSNNSDNNITSKYYYCYYYCCCYYYYYYYYHYYCNYY